MGSKSLKSFPPQMVLEDMKVIAIIFAGPVISIQDGKLLTQLRPRLIGFLLPSLNLATVWFGASVHICYIKK
jgi:hypothetical protein